LFITHERPADESNKMMQAQLRQEAHIVADND